MTAFIPHLEVEDIEQADDIPNPDPFYPSLSLSDFRLIMRQDDIITDARLAHHLRTAMLFINGILQPWRTTQTAFLLADENQQQLYKNAIYHRAKTYILESYRDIDTTADGEQQAESYERRIAAEQQREREAIRLLTQRPRTTICLI